MPRLSGSFLLGFAVPSALLIANLVWGLGGILVTIALFVWIGLAVILVPTDED